MANESRVASLPHCQDTRERDRLSTRLLHGPRLKREITRAMNWLGRTSPRLSLSFSTALRELAFPFRSGVLPPPLKLRDDVQVYANLFREATTNFSNTVSRFRAETNWPRGRIFNNLFESVDAELYYSMIRSFKPSQVIEIGAGNSTWFARDALRANRHGTLSAIDPSTRLALPRECHLEKLPLQEVDLSCFRTLQGNDILFIDASHTMEEALYVTERIYPVLCPGVFIHHHDISFPYAAFASVVRDLGDTEQTVMLDFLLHHAKAFEVFTSAAFVGYENPDLVRRLVPSSVHARRSNQSSLWIRKVKN